MTGIEDILDFNAKDFYYIGSRLKEIRNELYENDDVEFKRDSNFTRHKIAESLGVGYSTITNIERGPISINTIKLILYYYNLGYNPMWILFPDNEFISKKNVGENVLYQKGVQEEFKVMEETIMSALKNYKKKI